MGVAAVQVCFEELDEEFDLRVGDTEFPQSGAVCGGGNGHVPEFPPHGGRDLGDGVPEGQQTPPTDLQDTPAVPLARPEHGEDADGVVNALENLYNSTRGLPVHRVNERQHLNAIEVWEWAVEQGIPVSRTLLDQAVAPERHAAVSRTRLEGEEHH